MIRSRSKKYVIVWTLHTTRDIFTAYPPPRRNQVVNPFIFMSSVIFSATILFMLGSGLGVAMATHDGCSRCAECLSKQALLLLVSENNVQSEVPRVLNFIFIPRHGH
jgi:hypothetical protein